MPSKIKKRPISPRQKMINLMYIVLMAMLALNVSNDVLKGFTLIERSLSRTNDNAAKEIQDIYDDFNAQYKQNPAKVKVWLDKANHVIQMSDSLYRYADELKRAIARAADGKDANPNHLTNREDLEAGSSVMLAPVRGQGRKLYNSINYYREEMLKYISDHRLQAIVASDLSTEVPKNDNALLGKNWEQYMFEDMPAVAAITMLTKLQNDIRSAEIQVLRTLRANIDLKDIRVNELNAFVLPEATTLMTGETFRSRIIMAATDTTQLPEIYVNGRRIAANGQYNFNVGAPGEYSFSGYILMPNAMGQVIRRNFTQHYNVIAPPMGATVAADLMNVLYAGFDNPISVSASGVTADKINLTVSGGTLKSVGKGKYIARPAKVGQDVVFTVTGTVQGRTDVLGRYSFKVRRLPDPTAYLAIGDTRFKGGRLGKGNILAAGRLYAAIDDGLLDIQFKVNHFETVFLGRMGEAVIERSNGNLFSDGQLNLIRQMRPGQMFYIRGIVVSGPDGTTRTLPQALEVIVN